LNIYRPVIENANKVAPTFSKLFKEMILITSQEKPILRSGKGTVMRKLSLQIYNDEIEALYEQLSLNATMLALNFID